MGNRRRTRMAIITVLGSLALTSLVGFLLLEFIFRVYFPQPLGVSYRSEMSLPVHTPNYTLHRKESEFEITTTFNSLGLRDREVEIPKPPGTYRILVLGDSITAALEVADEEVYTEVLETLLNTPPSATRHYEVVNAGVSGFGQGDELKMFEYVGRRLEPDYVLVQMSPINDLSENLFCRWYRVENGKIRSLAGQPPSLPVKIEEALGRRSHLIQFLRSRLHSRFGKRAEYLRKTFEHKRTYHDFLFQGIGQASDFDRDWEVTFTYLEALHDRAKACGAGFGVIIRPLDIDVRGAREETYPLDLIKGFCRERKIPFLDLTEPFRERSGGDLYKIRFRKDSHWTPTGHRWAAEAIEEFLREERV